MPKLEIHDLRAGYGSVCVLQGMNFSVPAGVVTAIIGSNGAGKTTTLRTIMGLTRVFGGGVIVDGVPITGWSTHRIVREASLAIVPEGRQLFPELTVRENLIVGAYAIGISMAEQNTRIHEISQMLPVVRAKLRHKANSLSGGEQQLVAIGRALMSRPGLLLADEVSQGVSPMLTLELWQIFRRVAANGTTVVLVEQNVAAALRVASHAVVVRGGQVISEGSPDIIKSDERIRNAYLN